jgi:signal transduction histidine kinase
MTIPSFSKFLQTGYKRKTLLLVSHYTATITIFFVAIFAYQALHHKKMDDDRTVSAVSKMLAQSMRMSFFSGNKKELQLIAEQTIETFHISKVQVLRPDGALFLEVPSTPITEKMASSRSPITINQDLDPTSAISGAILPDQQIGIVVASTLGSDRKKELNLTIIIISVTGCILWLFSTYSGYLIMRKLTQSFDNLIEAIGDIEQGKDETIEIDLHEDASFIANSINRLSKTLHERERQNLSLQQEITYQMKQRAETAEQIMQAKLIQADKMATLGLLVGSMGHEINNPNAMIRLQIEYINKFTIDAQPLLRAFAQEEGNFYLAGMPFKEAEIHLLDSIKGIHDQTFRIERVISELRNYASADPKKRDFIGLDRVVTGTMVLLKPELRRYEGKIVNKIDSQKTRSNQPDTSYTGSDRRSKVFANQYAIQQVMVNLLLNAIRGSAFRGQEGRVHIEIYSRPDTVEIIIADNGEGIHPDDLPKLCDPYFSRNQDKGGTGLGLFIANQIIEDHNASMVFQSDLGIGTSVHLTFPAIRGNRNES